MDQNESSNSSLFQLNLDAQNSYTLRSAASWAKVLGVVGLILGILFIFVGLIIQQYLGNSRGYRPSDPVLSSSTIVIAGMAGYVLTGLIFIVSSVFALNAGNKITNGLRANDQATLNAGFAAARNYFAFWAIMIIILLLLVLLGIMAIVGE